MLASTHTLTAGWIETHNQLPASSKASDRGFALINDPQVIVEFNIELEQRVQTLINC